MPWGYGNAPAAPDIPVDVTPSAGLTDSDLAVGLRVGKVAINSAPTDHSTVEVLGHTFEFVVEGDPPEAEGAVAVRRGVQIPEVEAASKIIVAATPQGSSNNYFTLGSKTYLLAATDPENENYVWVDWDPPTSQDGATAIASAINTADSAHYTATAGGPDGNGCYHVTVTAVDNESLTINNNVPDLSIDSIPHADAYVATDSTSTVALALATAISNHTPAFIEAAIDPAHTNEVILISLE